MKKKTIKWILVLLCMGLIFYFSSRNREESMNQSRSVVDKINVFGLYEEREVIYEDGAEIGNDIVFRKIAHIIEYLVLAVLVCSLVSEYNSNLTKILIISFIVCFIYSCSDEIHQLFVSGRGAEIKDILIDNVGIGVGILGYYFFKRRKL